MRSLSGPTSTSPHGAPHQDQQGLKESTDNLRLNFGTKINSAISRPVDGEQDYRSSLTMTLAETNYCDKNGFDPEDPRCAKVIFTGKIKRLKPGTPKWFFAQDALFSRHPAMQTWPAGHNWYFAKMKIEQIALLDYFGGPKFINVKEYLAAPPEVIQPIKATQV
uniref:CREG-like beta-barrel domain-containing protein n=2 Tax=Timema TaxID=61471 RepID=A0A7R9FI22_9NEOP|nr:unnamed protein product [Timema bartmani]CAD7453860.1 unnamed protein product [Timema tahoe]